MVPSISQAIIKQCDDVSQVLKSLSHPIRLKILCCVLAQEKSVGELTEFCKISQSAMSQFLSRMKFEGLLSSRKTGTRVLYSISEPKLVRLLKSIKEIYCD